MRGGFRRSIGLVIAVGAATHVLAGDTGWSVVATPNVGTLSNVLNGVSVAPSTMVIAVGHRYDPGLAAYRTLVLRRSAGSWQVSATPNVGNGYNELYAVAARSDDDVWAVGYSRQGLYSSSRPLILHWNGASWQVVPTNVPFPGDLRGVAATAADDAWAVGTYASGGVNRPLALHWNGVQWSRIDPPVLGTYAALTGVSALTADDVWAVGYGKVGARYVTLAEHWDGASWSSVPTPNPGPQANYLRGVVALSPGAAWAVGTAQGAGSFKIRWDGSAWRRREHAHPNQTLWSVTARDADDVWAAGYLMDSAVGIRTVIEHWDGQAWTREATPNPGSNPALFGVAAGADAVWTVGLSNNGSADRTLGMRAAYP
jgi:hypothetical protein